jgi:hypothetical protein
VRGLWHGSPFFVEPKLLLKSVFAIFYFVCYSLSAQSEVITAEAGFIPEMGGSFCIEGRHYFYVGREKKLLILDDTLKPVQNLNLMTDTAAIDFADVTKSGRESLLEFSQTGVHVRHFEKNGFGNATRIAASVWLFRFTLIILNKAALQLTSTATDSPIFFCRLKASLSSMRTRRGKVSPRPPSYPTSRVAASRAGCGQILTCHRTACVRP